MNMIKKIYFTWRGHTYIHTYKQHTDGHCDSMTDPAQRAKSVKNPYRSKIRYSKIQYQCKYQHMVEGNRNKSATKKMTMTKISATKTTTRKATLTKTTATKTTLTMTTLTKTFFLHYFYYYFDTSRG